MWITRSPDECQPPGNGAVISKPSSIEAIRARGVDTCEADGRRLAAGRVSQTAVYNRFPFFVRGRRCRLPVAWQRCGVYGATHAAFRSDSREQPGPERN